MKHIKGERRERGQSLVELAISLVILLYLLSGAVEFGIIFFQYVQLRDAAQEGALYGSTHPTSADLVDIENRVRASSSSPINLADTGLVTVTISIDDDGDTTTPTVASTDANYTNVACEGDNHGIKVEVYFEHKVFMPFMSKFIGPKIPLNATVTDTILRPACP